MSKKKKTNKARNWHALNAILGRKTGPHTDQKKEADKTACRTKVSLDKED